MCLQISASLIKITTYLLTVQLKNKIFLNDYYIEKNCIKNCKNYNNLKILLFIHSKHIFDLGKQYNLMIKHIHYSNNNLTFRIPCQHNNILTLHCIYCNQCLIICKKCLRKLKKVQRVLRYF